MARDPAVENPERHARGWIRDVLARVHDAVRRRFGLELTAVFAIRKRAFSRTTSGKLVRGEIRALLRGERDRRQA